SISALALGGNILYAGGTFTEVDGVARNRAAAFNITTGALAAWNPNVDGRVEALAVSGSTVYVGGQFSNIGGEERDELAAVSATTGVATGWNPLIVGTKASVNNLQSSGDILYVGGYFSSAGGG